MKKFYFFLTVILMALVSVGVTSCGDDKDEPKSSDVVGTWQFKTVDEGVSIESLIQFTKNGQWHSVDIYTEDGKTEIDVEHGTYTISGDKLNVTYPAEGINVTETLTFVVKGDKLMLTYQDYPLAVTLTRVKDSVIEKYL